MPLPTSSAAPILPNEIWEQILSHLDKFEVQRLRGVNSLFLNFALNSRYQDVTLFQLYDNKLYSSDLLCRLMKRTLNLRRPEISRRIRSLRLDASHAYSWDLYPDYYRPPICEKWSTALRASRFRHFGPNLRSIAQDLLLRLDNLHTLSILPILLSPEGEEAFLSLVAVIWKHQFQKLGPEAMTLRTLQVDYCAGIGLRDIIQVPRSPQERMRCREALGRLERLDFRIDELTCTGILQHEPAEEIRLITSFLGMFTATYPTDISSTSHSRFTSNLTTLSIRFCCGDPPSIPVKVIDDIFGSLSTEKTQPPFPNLSHLSIVVTDTRQCPSKILEFLALQRHTITQLRASCNIFHALPHPIDMNRSELEIPPERHWNRAAVMTRLTRLEITTGARRARFRHASTLWSYLVQASPALDDDRSEGISTVIIDPALVITYRELYGFLKLQPRFWPRTLTFAQDIAWMPIFKEALSRIQNLSLKLFVLSPAHLEMILTNMPNLRSLHISVLAHGAEFPFRPSSHIVASDNECFNRASTYVSIPSHPERDGLYPSFLEELNQREHQKQNGGYTGNEELEELRICLERVEEEVLEVVTNALKGAYPGVKQVVVGNHVWVDHGFFNDTW